MLFAGKSTEVHEADEELPFNLRSARKSDAAILANYFERNREFLQPWDPKRDVSFYTESGWRYKIHHLQELEKLNQSLYLLIVDKEDTTVQGVISFSNVSGYPFHNCNLGYSLDKAREGQGVMTTALPKAINYVFESMRVHRIQASYMPHNHRSEQVLNKLGFEREGFAKNYLLINGQWEDHVLTSLTNHNWTQE
ncbi:ribosomal-protein-S5p-alanine acetyltransferase [Vibrio ishigakensis]|uniref:Ribosomal-protein-S5p-alanine acetyltransferase n=1 Tax=Vibrio ishigakensis TaxID=1481914 RepID=A0A0B8P478_9VIBR|nr:ribosomal protein S5-alanine N-acetyltransferase [Vibrio ishigakensis]GAM58098.1 ribosomal-protein-S5p-alanine acetyltransferase [Vibrio ishigakensis]